MQGLVLGLEHAGEGGLFDGIQGRKILIQKPQQGNIQFQHAAPALPAQAADFLVLKMMGGHGAVPAE